jgi:hypothetical protein
MQSFIFKSIVVVVYTSTVAPFKSPGSNHVDIFNEATIMVTTYLCIAYTDFIIDNRLKYELGWYVIYIFIFCLAVNFGYIFLRIGLMVAKKIMKKFKKK